MIEKAFYARESEIPRARKFHLSQVHDRRMAENAASDHQRLYTETPFSDRAIEICPTMHILAYFTYVLLDIKTLSFVTLNNQVFYTVWIKMPIPKPYLVSFN